MHHRPGGLLRGSLQPRLQPLLRLRRGRPGVVLREGCGSPGRPRCSTPAPGRDSHPLLCPVPTEPARRGKGPTRRLLQSTGPHFPLCLREGEEGRETLLSVAIVNPNNNNKEKSLQLGPGWIRQLLLLPITIRNNYPESRAGSAAKVFWIIASKWTAKYKVPTQGRSQTFSCSSTWRRSYHGWTRWLVKSPFLTLYRSSAVLFPCHPARWPSQSAHPAALHQVPWTHPVAEPLLEAVVLESIHLQ